MLFKKRKRKSQLTKAVSEAVARRARLIEGTAPRVATPKAWPPGKPPGGKIPPEAKPSAQDQATKS